MDETQFTRLTNRIDIMTKMLALFLVKDRPITDQVRMLSSTGLKVKEIAEILGRTENQVYVTQTRLRKKNIASSIHEEHPENESNVT
jgi:hypothetical protein